MRSPSKVLTSLAVAACCGGVTAKAQAEPESAHWTEVASRAPESDREVTLRWYGWQLLLVDAANLGLAAAVGDPRVMYLTVPVYLGSGIVVHGLHDRAGAAGGSFGLRLALPLLGVAVGAAIAPPCEGLFCGLEYPAVGFLIGVGTAITLDATALSFETVPSEHELSIGVLPIRDGGGVIAASGRF